MIIKVKVTPGARMNKVIGMKGDTLIVRVQAPPEDGKANQALIELVAEHFKVPKRCVIIQSGLTSRLKLLVVETNKSS